MIRRVFLYLLCAAISHFGGHVHAISVAPGYEISEIPYGGGPIVWIDNNTVLFIGAPLGRRSQSRQINAPDEITLYRWNTGTGEVKDLMKAGKYPSLCYDRGYLYVAFDRGQHRVIREGLIGYENETIIKRGTRSGSKGSFNRYNCRFLEVPVATRPGRTLAVVLRDDHGFIETERSPAEGSAHRRYFLVRPSGEEVLLNNFVGAAGGPLFLAHRQAYVFQYGGSDLSEYAEKHVWLIGIDGSVIDYKLPHGPWLGGAVRAMPVRDGLLMISPSTLTNAEGVYLARGQQVERIVKGHVNDFSVSPEGCKVAIYIRPDDGSSPRHALLNTCKERR